MEPTIRIGALAGFHDLVFELGGDPKTIFKLLQLADEPSPSPDTCISLTNYRRAMALAGKQTNMHNFGLLLSQRQNLEEHGVLGYLTKHAATLGIAIETWIAYLKRYQPSVVTNLTFFEQTALWEVRLPFTPAVSDHDHAEAGAGLVVKFIRQNLDPLWNPEAVHFNHTAPNDKTLHNRIFRCPIFFRSERGYIEFPVSDLERPLRYSDPILFQLLQSYEQSQTSLIANTFKENVQFRVGSRIEGESINIDAIAQVMGLSRSQLQSKLKAEGCNFREIVSLIRVERAKKLLCDSQMTLTQIADNIGYAQLAVFTRAFKRRTGTTPSLWRRRSGVKNKS